MNVDGLRATGKRESRHENEDETHASIVATNVSRVGNANVKKAKLQRLARSALIRSHLPIFGRPGMSCFLAISYRCWRLRSSSARPASPLR